MFGRKADEFSCGPRRRKTALEKTGESQRDGQGERRETIQRKAEVCDDDDAVILAISTNLQFHMNS